MLKEAINAQKSRNETRFLENYVIGFVLNQMTSKDGTRKHGEKVIQAILKEFVQLEDEETLKPVDSTKLTREQKNH